MILTSSEDATVVSNPLTGTADVNTHYRVISDNSLDNFLLDVIFTFTIPDLTATYKIQNARCGG